MTDAKKRPDSPDIEIPELVRQIVLTNTSNPLAALKNWRVAEVNDGWVTVLGYDSREELIGLHIRDLLTPESSESGEERSTRRRRGEQVSPKHIYSMIHRSGRIIKVEVTGMVWPADPRIVFSIAVDVTQHMKQIKALEESEKLYRTLAETVPEGVMLADTTGRNIYVNDQIQQISGYTAEELAAGPWIIDPENNQSRQIYEEALTEGTSGTGYEDRLTRKDGSSVWVSISWNPVRDEDGQIIGLHTTFTDISSRKAAEQALRDGEASVRSFVNALVYPAFLIDLTGKIIMANEALARRFNITVDELIGSNSADLVSESVASARGDWARKVVQTGKPIEFEDERAGLLLRHYMSPVFDANGKVSKVAWVAVDITEQRKAEDDQREAKERFRLLAENATDVIWEIDIEGKFTYISPAVRLWGYEPDEWLGKRVDEFLPVEERQAFSERLARDLRNPTPRRYEVSMVRKDGTIAWCEVSVDVVMEGGRPVRVQGISRDITERKRAGDALREAHDELEKAFRIQQEFVNNVTHEVRTPMTAVKGYVEMLLEGIAGPVTDEQAAMLQKVLASSDDLLSLVSSLLEAARLRSGGVSLHPKACKPGDLAAKAMRAVTPQAARKGLSLVLNVSGTDRVGVYDEQKATIVLRNLLSNAVKFTLRGRIDVTVNSSNGYAEFVIVDTGIGIKRSDLGGIFDEFQQLDQPHKHKPSGFGLGLAIVARMVEIVGGTIVVSSRRGVGTAFTLRIPEIEA